MTNVRRGLVNMFVDDERFLQFAAIAVGAIAICKGLRFPNLWSATQAQIDYRHGFVKRGLFGEVVTAILGLNHYARFAMFSFLALAIVLLLLVGFVRRSGIMRSSGTGAAVVVFASSLAVTNISNLVGYFDILEIGLTVCLLLIRRPIVRFLASLPIGAACILLHESFLLSFFPLLLFSFYVDFIEGRTSTKTVGLQIASLTLAAFALTVAVAIRPSISMDQLPKLEQEVSSRTDFHVRHDFFLVLSRSTADNFAKMRSLYLRRGYWYRHLSVVLALVSMVAFITFYASRFCKAAENKTVMRHAFVALILVGCMPLGIHLLGFDIDRFYSVACIAFFLGFVLLVRSMPTVSLSLSPGMRNVMLLVVAVNMASGEVLLDVTAPRQFPFVTSVFSYFDYFTENHHNIQPGK